jgi:hypothetical protein
MKSFAYTLLVVSAVAVGWSMLANPQALAQAAVKTGCPNKMVAKCPPNTERVCTKTDSKGCCTKSSCQAKKK